MLAKSGADAVLQGNVIGLWNGVEGNSAEAGGKFWMPPKNSPTFSMW